VSAAIVKTVGLRSWFLGMLTRGTPPPLDPNELVEFATLPLFEATLLTEKLRSHGLDASCAESFNVATSTTANGRVLLPRGQLDEARRVDTAN
jgi:hypothetical protein